MISLDTELAKEYLAECREHLATIETNLRAMAEGGANIDKKWMYGAFRAAHWIKGGAAVFLGLAGSCYRPFFPATVNVMSPSTVGKPWRRFGTAWSEDRDTI